MPRTLPTRTRHASRLLDAAEGNVAERDESPSAVRREAGIERATRWFLAS